MHWFKRSSAFDLQYCYCNGWGDEMTGKHFLSEELFHRDIRRFEHVALHPPAWAWQCNISLRLGLAMETSAALQAGPGTACRGNCVHQREEKEAGGDVWSDSAECRAGSCQRRLLQRECSTGYRMEGEHPRQQEGRNKTVHGVKIHCAFVAIATRNQEFAWRVKANPADVSMQTPVFTDNKAVARKQLQQNTL